MSFFYFSLFLCIKSPKNMNIKSINGTSDYLSVGYGLLPFLPTLILITLMYYGNVAKMNIKDLEAGS